MSHCSVCKTTFTNKEQLKKHLVAENHFTGNKPFKKEKYTKNLKNTKNLNLSSLTSLTTFIEFSKLFQKLNETEQKSFFSFTTINDKILLGNIVMKHFTRSIEIKCKIQLKNNFISNQNIIDKMPSLYIDIIKLWNKLDNNEKELILNSFSYSFIGDIYINYIDNTIYEIVKQ